MPRRYRVKDILPHIGSKRSAASPQRARAASSGASKAQGFDAPAGCTRYLAPPVASHALSGRAPAFTIPTRDASRPRCCMRHAHKTSRLL